MPVRREALRNRGACKWVPRLGPGATAIKLVVFLLTLSVLMMACTSWRAFRSESDIAPQPRPAAQATVASPETEASSAIEAPATTQPVATSEPSPAPPVTTPQPSLAPEQESVLPQPEPLISEVLREVQPPQAVAEPVEILGGTQRMVPAGTGVVWGGCASDGTCYPFNFYWAPTNEVVMQNGEGEHKVQHELCHAHQHWSINGGEPLPPSDYDLESWYATEESGSFTAAVAGLPWPWTHSAESGLEDFAWTCGYWYSDAAYLLQVSPQRYAWAAAYLP